MDTLLSKRVSFKEFTELQDKSSINTLFESLNGRPYYETLLPLEQDNQVIPHILPSYMCNYRCTYCYEKARKHIVDQITPESLRNIDLFYKNYDDYFNTKSQFKRIIVSGGEPFLPQNKTIINAILNHWNNIPIDFITNGTYLEEFKKELLNHSKITLSVSLDGIKEIHYKKRIPLDISSYDTMLSGVTWALSNNIDVYINCIFHPEYMNYYGLLFDMLEKMGWLTMQHFHVLFSLESNGPGETVDLKYLDNTLKCVKELKKIDKRMEKVDLDRLLPGCQRLFGALYYAEKLKCYSPYRCPALYKPSYAFTPDGKVILCSCMESASGEIGAFWPQVQIYTDKIQQIRRRRIETLNKCRECTKRVMCMGGCLAAALSDGYDISESYCGIWENPFFLKYLGTD